MSLLYHFGNPRSKRFKLFTPGSILFAGLFIVGTMLFNFYISNISTYNLLYGSIGGLIIFVIWIYFNCILILIGYELNKSITKAQTFKFPDMQLQIEDAKTPTADSDFDSDHDCWPKYEILIKKQADKNSTCFFLVRVKSLSQKSESKVRVKSQCLSPNKKSDQIVIGFFNLK